MMKIWKRISCLFLALCVVLALPVEALAETYYLEDGFIVVTTDESSQYVAQGSNNAVAQTTETVITQRAPETPTSNTVTIDTSAEGAKPAEVTIQDVNIKPTSAESAITVTSGSSAEITVQGENKVEGGNDRAGVSVTEGTSLTITAKSTGSLEATGSFGSAGIGGSKGSGPSGNNVDGGDGENAGTVTINGGAITATGGLMGTGIGGGEGTNGLDATSHNQAGNGGNGGNGGTVTINGGTVTANGGPSIGGGNANWGGSGLPSGEDGEDGKGGDGGSLTINGGTVILGDFSIISTDNGSDATLAHNGGTLTTKDGTTSKPDLPLPGQEPAPTPQPEPAPEPTPTPTPEAAPLTYVEEEPEPVKIGDWDALIGLIRNTPEGSEFIYDAGYRTWIPRTVIKVAQDRNITLIIKWRGGEDITVKPDDNIDLTMWQIFLKDLV